MTTKQMAPLIGQRGSWFIDGHQDGMTIDVKVLDVRVVFNRMDLLVAPISGTGSRWVMAAAVRLGDLSGLQP